MKINKSVVCRRISLSIALLFASGTATATATATTTTEKKHDYFSGEHKAYLQTSGKVVGSYIANWANPNIVDTVNGNNLSHILYAFLRICGPGQLAADAEVCLNKQDFQLAEDGSTIDKAFEGKFSQLKLRYPHLKVIPSVGGWGGSAPFVPMSATPENRKIFIQSVVDYLSSNPSFDGIDIDWEWPQNQAEGEAYADLMIELRKAFDLLEQQNGRKYLITSAIGTHSNNISHINYVRAEPYMDYIFMMTYDFFGRWSSNNIGHHTALQAHNSNLNKGYAHSGALGTKNMIDLGIPAEKLVLGVAKYARGWDGVTRSNEGTEIGGTATGLFPKPKQPWDTEGVATYRRVVEDILGHDGQGINGFEVRYDGDCDCHYAWRESDAAFVGFDHPKDVINKGRYVQANKLAGVFSWEYGQDNGDILNAMNDGVGNQLEQVATTTWLSDKIYYQGDSVLFNGVKYTAQWWTKNDQPDLGLPWQESDNTAVGLWQATTAYLKDDRVIYNGLTYQAKWWTKNNEPGQSGSPWQQL